MRNDPDGRAIAERIRRGRHVPVCSSIGRLERVSIAVVDIPRTEERMGGGRENLAAVVYATNRSICRNMPEHDHDPAVAHFRPGLIGTTAGTVGKNIPHETRGGDAADSLAERERNRSCRFAVKFPDPA